MLNFIVYEHSQKYQDKYFSVIDRFIGKSKLAYHIIELGHEKDYTVDSLKAIPGYKIYILSAESPEKSGLDFAKEIRDSGDWDSQMILVSEHEDLRNYDYQRKILMLAFINKFFDLDAMLLEAIQIAHNILTRRQCIQFSKKNGIYRIPLSEISQFKKEEEESRCYIEAKDGLYITDKTLTQMEKDVQEDPRFIRTHRNHIVNAYNIRAVDFDNNLIQLDNNNTAEISKNYKKSLKEFISKGKYANGTLQSHATLETCKEKNLEKKKLKN